VPIRVIALGITGSVRGVNVDDYRPDLIVVDDPCDEENTATPEQRKKTADLFFGALAKSLAPASEAPLAKMVLLQTVLNEDDLISLTVKDPQWKSVVYSCFDNNGESRWPERWSTKELMEEKEAHIARAQLPLWLREMECKIVDDSTAAFPSRFMQYWEVLPEHGRTIIAVDPTPPPRESSSASRGDLDDAAIVVLRESKGQVYVVDTYTTKSPDPEEFISKIFELCMAWRCREVHIETILFARMLATMLEKEMLARRQWLTIRKVEDRRKKDTRIRQEISALYTARKIYFHNDQGELIEQLNRYPSVNHDDLLDALAIGIAGLGNWLYTEDWLEGEYANMGEEVEALPDDWMAAP
jgi:predicted phage terminase large subunit-like protein